MTFEIVPAYEVPFAEQAQIFNRAFKGYLAGWHDMDANVVARFLTAQGIDLCYSSFARANGELLAFGFINRTGNISRLAGMGTVPEARRTGAATFMLSHLLDQAKQRSDEAMVLEVFEQNTPAVPLYRRYGFQELMRLFGWRRTANNSPTNSTKEPEEISLLAASKMEHTSEFPHIPWQVSRHIVPKLAGARAFRIGNGCVIIANPETPPIRIHAMFGDDKDIQTVLASVISKFSAAEFFAPAVFPESVTVFEPLGFKREPLNQFLMRQDLRS